jgi:hypothetical protein
MMMEQRMRELIANLHGLIVGYYVEALVWGIIPEFASALAVLILPVISFLGSSISFLIDTGISIFNSLDIIGAVQNIVNLAMSMHYLPYWNLIGSGGGFYTREDILNLLGIGSPAQSGGERILDSRKCMTW